MPCTIHNPYHERPAHFAGLREHGAWRLKCYDIAYPGARVESHTIDPGVTLALRALPEPAPESGRPGVGFLIRHAGKGMNYVVLCWWGRENELPIRVFLHEHNSPDGWRAAMNDESVCVWDLQVIARERDAYVQHVLTHARADLDAYLEAHP